MYITYETHDAANEAVAAMNKFILAGSCYYFTFIIIHLVTGMVLRVCRSVSPPDHVPPPIAISVQAAANIAKELVPALPKIEPGHSHHR